MNHVSAKMQLIQYNRLNSSLIQFVSSLELLHMAKVYFFSSYVQVVRAWFSGKLAQIRQN